MPRNAIVVGFVAVAVLCHPAVAEAGEPAPKRQFSLATLVRTRPRLILTDARLAELKQLAEKDRLLKKCFRDVVERADRYCNKRPLAYQKRGPRLLHVSRECLQRVYALALAWRITGRKVYADKARDNLLTVCAFKDWNPSHFLDTAEMSHAVAIGYDWLHEHLGAAGRETIRTGLINNGLKPGVAAYGGRGAGWAGSAFNWNQVCNSGLVIGALAVADSDPAYARTIIPKALASLPKALASYDPDGAWPEGPGYWHYATRYTAFGLAAMKTALGTDFGLSEAKGLSQAGLFPILACGPTNLFVNFADVGDRSRRGRMPCLFWLARRYGNEVMAAGEREVIARTGAGPLDLVWYVPPSGKKLAPLPLDKLFRGPVELAVFRSAWNDPKALFVSVKAGYNQVNHGHLDLGTFELDAMGVRWARDLGSDNYNLPGYWQRRPGGRRWTYYRLGSLSHSVPLLNGKNQDPLGKAKVIQFKSAPSSGFATVDLTSAYKDFARKVTRGVAIVRNRRAVVVQDELELQKPCEVTWAMTTDANISLGDGRAILKQEGKRLAARILSPAGARFEVASAEQKPPERTNKGVRRLLISLKNQAGSVRVAVFFSPTWPDGRQAEPPETRPLGEW